MESNVSLNIEAIRQSAREQWFARRTKRRPWRETDLRQLIEISIPNMIIAVAFALFLLSAPHTSKMFDMITPGFGFAGVIMCEFGLLYIAFRRKVERKANGKLPHVIRGLEVLIFITSVLVNAAGSLIAVATSAGIATLSAETIFKGLSTMPIVAQVGLLLVPLAALIIPIGTVVAGEGLAAHVLEGKHLSAELVAEWSNVEQLEVYRMAYSYLLARGANSRDAQRRAGSATTNLFHRPLPPDVLYVESETAAQSASEMPSASVRRTVFRTSGRSSTPTRRQDARTAVRDYLEQNPGAAGVPVRQLAKMSGVSKTIAGEELKAWKEQYGKV